MLPVVALVGRPNVGKSTLFNRLTNTRDALVADYPGLTRDRKYGQAKYEQRQFIVVDTGGITGDEEGIDAEMAQQSLLAIEEADVVMFLVDARAGLLPADKGIADHLRRINKQVFVVANKVDGIDGDSESAEFYALGLGNVKQIAAIRMKRRSSGSLDLASGLPQLNVGQHPLTDKDRMEWIQHVPVSVDWYWGPQ